MISYLAAGVLVLALLHQVACVPHKLSSCSAQLDDGSIVDLSSLDNSAVPRAFWSSNFQFLFNPCSPLSCGQFSDVGICQVSNYDKTNYDLGEQSSMNVSLDSDRNLIFTYTSNTTIPRASNIKCVCGSVESFKFYTEYPTGNYMFTFQSPCCCPNGCSSQGLPKKLSSCSAQLPAGSIIDLSSLDDPNNPRRTNGPANIYNYTFNPCSPLTCGSYLTSGICQNDPKYQSSFDLGDQNTVSFMLNSKSNLVMWFYSYTDYQMRHTQIECVCAPKEDFTYLGENPQLYYNFQFASPCCCPNGCKGGGGVTRLGPCTAQLSNGSIIDLSSLDQAKNPRESDMGDYKYFFNPCSPIACNTDTDDAAFCQDSSDGQTSFDLGDQKSSTFTFNENDDFLKIQYKSSYRTSNLLCVCADTELFTFVNEYPALNYTFVFYSPCCCAGGCSSTPKPEVPKKIGACKAQYSDGSIIDLSAVDKIAPLQSNTRDYTFIYKPCTPITIPTNCVTGPNTAICQYSNQAAFDCGDLDVTYGLDTDNTLLMVYQSSDRVSKIRCVCDNFLSFNFIQENPLKNYIFELRSECCCKNGCSSSSQLKDAVIDLLDV